MTTPSATLATFAARLQFTDIPDAVVRKTEDFLMDLLVEDAGQADRVN